MPLVTHSCVLAYGKGSGACDSSVAEQALQGLDAGSSATAQTAGAKSGSALRVIDPCDGSSAERRLVFYRERTSAQRRLSRYERFPQNRLLCWKPNRSSVSCAGGCSANTVAFFSSGLVVESPSEHRPHFADVLHPPVRLSRLLRAGFGYEEVCRPCRFRVSEGGSFTGGARGKAGLFVTFH